MIARQLSRVAWLLVLFPSIALAADPPPRPVVTNPLAGSVLEVTNPLAGSVWIMPSEMPPSRTELHFDCVEKCDDWEVGMEVSWDPDARGGLKRLVLLGPGKWQVSLSAEPMTRPSKTGAIVSGQWTMGSSRTSEGDQFEVPVTTDGFEVPVTTDGEVPVTTDGFANTAHIRLKRGTSSHPLDLFEANLATRGGVVPQTGRGLGLSPATGIEVLDVLGSIVVKRVGQAAQRLVRKRIVNVLCDKSSSHIPSLGLKGVMSVSDLAPQTCDALSGVDIFNLATSGEGLLKAVTADVGALVEKLMPVALKRAETFVSGREIIQSLAAVVVPIVAGRAATSDDARRIVGILLRLDPKQWESVHNSRDPNSLVRIAITAAGYCGATGECTPERMYVLVKRLMGPGFADIDRVLSFAHLVHRAYFTTGQTPREMIDTGLSLVTEVFKLVDADVRPEIARTVGLLRTAAQGDLVATIAALGALMKRQDCGEHAQSEVANWLRLVGGVASTVAIFVASDPSGLGAKEDKAARREAQEAAVERLIDTLSDRSTVESGDLLVSIGGTLRGGGAWWTSGGGIASRPSLSFGLGVDWVFSAQHDFGLHMDFGVLDIGNYLREKPPEKTSSDDSEIDEDPPADPWDLIDLSATVSAYFFAHDTPLFVGWTVGYVPSVGEGYTGFLVGIWIPFWDL